MATLATNIVTMADLAKSLDPNGQPAKEINLLSQRNDIWSYMPVEQGNLPTGHRTTVVTGMPTISSRKLNEGVTPGKGTTAQIEDSCGLYEHYLPIDKKLVDNAPNPTAFRMQQHRLIAEAFSQKITQQLFYGNATITPSDFTGLTPRYNSTSGNIGNYVINAAATGGQTDLTSMWLLDLGPDTITMVHPKGWTGGYTVEDKGEQIWQSSTTFGGSTSAFRAYVSWFEWCIGVSVRDYRGAVRICNIDVSDAAGGGLTGTQQVADTTFLPKLMIEAMHTIGNPGSKNLVWCCNRSISSALHLMALEKAVYNLTVDNFDGKFITRFLNAPIITVDQLTNAEPVVS